MVYGKFAGIFRERKMKKLFLVLIILSLNACGYADRVVATATSFSRICVDGVSYLQFTSGASVEYSPEGKVKTCR